MQCLQCQHENASDAKFCSQCGTPCAPKLKYLFGVDDALLEAHFAWGRLLFYFGEPVAAHTHLVSLWPYSITLIFHHSMEYRVSPGVGQWLGNGCIAPSASLVTTKSPTVSLLIHTHAGGREALSHPTYPSINTSSQIRLS
jgi:zinc-ribbon domain